MPSTKAIPKEAYIMLYVVVTSSIHVDSLSILAAAANDSVMLSVASMA